MGKNTFKIKTKQKQKKRYPTAAESRRKAQPSSLGSPQRPPECVSGRMLAPQTCGSRSSRRISPTRVWRPPSAASPPAPGAGESKGPALQVFLRWLQTVGFWVGALLTSRFGGPLCLMWLFSVGSAWCGPQTVGSSGSCISSHWGHHRWGWVYGEVESQPPAHFGLGLLSIS